MSHKVLKNYTSGLYNIVFVDYGNIIRVVCRKKYGAFGAFSTNDMNITDEEIIEQYNKIMKQSG